MPLVLLLGACGGDNDGFPTAECGGPDNPCPPYAVSLTVSPKESLLAVDTTKQYLALATYSDGSEKDVTATVTWQAADPSVASIAAGGKALALAGGATRISATLASTTPGASALSDDANLRVTDAALQALVVTPAEVLTLVGLDKAFAAVAFFADGHRQDVTVQASWSSLNSAVATVTNSDVSKGLARGITPGDAFIQASFGGMQASGELVVLSANPTALIVSPKSQSLPKGTGVALRADLLLEGGLSLDVTEQSRWQSASATIAAVDELGYVSALAPGQSGVSATLSFAGISLSDSSLITVTDAAVSALEVSPDNLSVPLGTSGSYRATAWFTDGTSADVSRSAQWQVADPAIIAIQSSGVAAGDARALSVGSTEISASFGGMTDSVMTEVTNAVLTALEISPLDASTAAGTWVNYSARASFSDGTVKEVTKDGRWFSADSNIAVINGTGAASGKARGLIAGQTQIGFSLLGETVQTGLTVTDALLTGLDISPKDLVKPVGTQGHYQALAYYSDGRVEDVTSAATWLSSSPAVVSIVTGGIDGGSAEARSTGSSQISATYGGLRAVAAGAPVVAKVAAMGDPQKVSALAAGSVTDSTSARVTNAILTALSITPLEAQVPAGNQTQYHLIAEFSDGQVLNVTNDGYWQTEEGTIASVNRYGLATGISPGTTVVMGRYLGMEASAQLLVTDAVLTDLLVTPASSTLPKGYEVQLDATAIYSDGSSKAVSTIANWGSDNQAIASVVLTGAEGGKVTALEVGSATVTASFEGKTAQATVTVTDAVLESLSLTPAVASIPVGVTQGYQLTGIFSDGKVRALGAVASWQSLDTSIASVRTPGVALGIKAGKVQIQAMVQGLKAQAELTVTEAVVTSLVVTPGRVQVPLGYEGKFTATAHYSDGHSQDVTREASWKSKDISVATVVPLGQFGGNAKGVGLGTTDVSASFNGMSGSSKVTVTNVQLKSYSISPVAATVAAGLSVQYQATGVFTDGTVQDLTRQSTWNTSDTSIADINRLGLANSHQAGEVQVQGSYIGFAATAKLTVTAAEVSQLILDPQNIKVPVGTQGRFTATAVYTDGHQEDVSEVAAWTVADPALVSVANGAGGGDAQALAVGITQVSATYAGLSAEATVEVTPATLVELTLAPAIAEVPTGLTLQYQAFARFSDGSNKDVTLEASWSTADGSIARIDRYGLAQGLYADKTQVQAMYLGYKAVGELTVTEPILMQLQITPAAAELPIEGTKDFSAKAIFSDGYIQDVTRAGGWTVDDAVIASVGTIGAGSGKVTGLSAGATRVNITYLGKTVSADVTVVNKVYLGLNVEPADSSVFVGSTRQMHAYAVYDDGTTEEVFGVLWQSSNPAQASIDKVGRAKGISEGSVNIYASYLGKPGEARLSVRPGVMTGFNITPASAYVPLGTKGRFKATAVFDGFYSVDVTDSATWSSDTPELVHIVTSGPQGGEATALQLGSAVVQAEYGAMKATAAVTVFEPEIERFEVTPEYLSLEPGMKDQLYATVYYVGGGSRDVTLDSSWQSNNPADVSVETGNEFAGQVEGYKDNGFAIVTATYQGMTDSAEVSVYVQPIDHFRFEPADIEVRVGQFTNVTLWAVFDDGHEEDYSHFIEISADDDTVVQAGKNGYVEGLAVGETILRARMDRVYGEAKVRVVP